MPARYTIRQFEIGGSYHVYNRGVEKRIIFMDDQDYSMFRYYLFTYIKPISEVLEKHPNIPMRLREHNLYGQVDLMAYCLMPNHFHLLLRQNSIDGVSRLLKQLTNAYTLYFNTKYNRVGGLMQGVFKAVEINSDELLLHVSRYIHLNPVQSGMVQNPAMYRWSSFCEYIAHSPKSLSNPQIVLEASQIRSYADFMQITKELSSVNAVTIDSS